MSSVGCICVLNTCPEIVFVLILLFVHYLYQFFELCIFSEKNKKLAAELDSSVLSNREMEERMLAEQQVAI